MSGKVSFLRTELFKDVKCICLHMTAVKYESYYGNTYFFVAFNIFKTVNVFFSTKKSDELNFTVCEYFVNVTDLYILGFSLMPLALITI